MRISDVLGNNSSERNDAEAVYPKDDSGPSKSSIGIHYQYVVLSHQGVLVARSPCTTTEPRAYGQGGERPVSQFQDNLTGCQSLDRVSVS